MGSSSQESRRTDCDAGRAIRYSAWSPLRDYGMELESVSQCRDAVHVSIIRCQDEMSSGAKTCATCRELDHRSISGVQFRLQSASALACAVVGVKNAPREFYESCMETMENLRYEICDCVAPSNL